jgi:hypothetical protein
MCLLPSTLVLPRRIYISVTAAALLQHSVSHCSVDLDRLLQARQLERDATLFQQFLQGTRAAVVLTVQQEYLAACCVTRPGQQRRLIGMCREAVDRPRLRAHRDMFDLVTPSSSTSSLP